MLPNSVNIIDVLSNRQIRLDKGWNHIKSNQHWQGLRFAANTYQFSETTPLQQKNCTATKVVHHSLVKKYFDWDQQHANGLLFTVTPLGLDMGNIKQVDLVLKINSHFSHILSSEQLQQALGTMLSVEEIIKIDKGNANIELRLRHQDNWVASSMLSIAPQYFDQWLHITLPFEQLQLWQNRNYQRIKINKAQIASKSLDNIVFVAETENRKVVRHFVNPLPDAFQERYKEINVTIKNFVIHTL